MIKKFDYDKVKHTQKLVTLHGLESKKILVAVSGGVDSVVLLHHLLEVSKRVSFSLSVAYVHHGLSGVKKTDDYRIKAQKFVRNLAKKYDLEFFTNVPDKTKNKSEEFLRQIRNDFLKKVSESEKFDFIAKAQMADDLLETRLIRLIRGVGPEGFLAMSEVDSPNFRPLLTWTKREILEYAKKMKLRFVQDPSNKDERYMRNWLRNNWLQSLEDYRAGAKSSLQKSLENLAQVLSQDQVLSKTVCEGKIDKNKLLVLKKSDQRRVLAHYLNHIRVKNYTSSQIDEILKRIDNSKVQLTFYVANCVWNVDTKHISASQKGTHLS